MKNSDLSALAYEAALAGDWGEFLAHYARSFGADGAWFIDGDLQTGQEIIASHVGFEEGTIASYHSYFQHRNPLRPAVADLSLGEPWTVPENVNEVEVMRTEFYCDFVVPLGFQLEATGALLDFSLGKVRGLALQYGAHRKRGVATSAATAQAPLLPHVCHAVSLEKRLAAVAPRTSDLSVGLELSGAAVVSCDQAGRVETVTSAALELLRLKDGLCYEQRYLVAAQLLERKKLRDLLALLCTKGPAAQLSATQTMRVSRPSGLPPFELAFHPLVSALPGMPSAHVLIFIDDPTQRRIPSAELLRSLFQLTPQEANVASRLAQGLTQQEIAEQLFVSRETVKTHSRAVYRKSNTRRQSEFVARAWSGSGALRHENRDLWNA